MKRKLLNFTVAVSLVLFLATVALWVRSYWVADVILLPKAEWWRRYTINSDLGTLIVWTEVLRPPSDSPYWDRLALDRARTDWLRTQRSKDIGWTGFAVRSTGVAHQLLMVSMPYWFLAVLTASLPAVSLLHKRRLHFQVCPICSYNLTGNTSGVCPECGTAVPKAPADKSPRPA